MKSPFSVVEYKKKEINLIEKVNLFIFVTIYLCVRFLSSNNFNFCLYNMLKHFDYSQNS